MIASASRATAMSPPSTLPRRMSAGKRRRSSSFCLKSKSSLDGFESLAANASQIPTLASLRVLVLAQLADIEARLALLDSPLSELNKLKSQSELSVDDAKAWVDDALDMVRNTRAHLPDVRLDVAAVEKTIRQYLPEWHLPGLDELRARLPDLPDLSFEDVRARFAELELPSIRARLPDLDTMVPSLAAHVRDLDDRLYSLNTHLNSFELPSSIVLPSFTPSKLLEELKLRASDLFADLREDDATVELKEEALAVRTARQVIKALKVSMNGQRLITYAELPEKWRNNEFVTSGYRFIPLQNWLSLLASPIRIHNETLNIHTHLIPLLLSGVTSLSVLGPHAGYADMPDQLYTYFARLCLLTSAVWHVFSGCAQPMAMEAFARLDYVGIGWLISASVASIVYYGLSCHRQAVLIYLTACLVSGIAGSILPFMPWFNERKHKKWRIMFFLSLAFTGIAPMTHLSLLHSTSSALAFVYPIAPSLATYVCGLCLYASHFPECMLPHPRPAWAWWTDWIGGGSHALWHLLIVLAIRLHRSAMNEMRGGFEGQFCPLW